MIQALTFYNMNSTWLHSQLGRLMQLRHRVRQIPLKIDKKFEKKKEKKRFDIVNIYKTDFLVS